MNIYQLLYGGCLLLVGLIAGLFFAYQCSVINGLGALKDREYLSAFQSINRVIQNPVFFTSFLGCVILLPIATYMSYKLGAEQVTSYLVASTIIYIIGVFGVTVIFNVPLNNALDVFDIHSATDSQAHAMRYSFETSWNRWNLVRTLAAIGSFLALVIPSLPR